MITLRNSINSKEIPENENPKKIVNIVEKILDFNKQQKDKGIKILTPKKMLQRLIYLKTYNSLYREKKLLKKYATI